MPTKRKFSAKFPTARIKKIIQLDDEIGKLAATVPPVVSRALELFIEQLISKSYELTLTRNSKTILPSCVKEVIENESGFSFLKPLVATIPSLQALAQHAESKTKSRSLSEAKIAKKRDHSSKQNNASSFKPRSKKSKCASPKQNRNEISDASDYEEEPQDLKSVHDVSHRNGHKRKHTSDSYAPNTRSENFETDD